MTQKCRSTVFVVIEDDPAKRAMTAERLCELKPLQIMFFESFRHARAFLASVQMKPGVKIEVVQRQAIEARKPWRAAKAQRATALRPAEVPA
jgi:hypothetical protein